MKNITITLLVIIFVSSIAYPQDNKKIEETLYKHLKATRGICNEIDTLNKTIKGLSEKMMSKDSIVIKNEILFDETKKENNQLPLWQRILPNAIGAFIGVLSGILLYCLGIWSEKNKENKKRRKEQKEKMDYFKSLSSYCLDNSKGVAKDIETFCKDIESNPQILPRLTVHAAEDFERLSKLLDNQDYFHSFLNEFKENKDSIKHYRSIAYSIDFFKVQQKQIYEIQEIKLKKDNERKKYYVDRAQQIEDELFFMAVQSQNTEPNFSKFIFETIDNYHKIQSKNNDFSNLEKYFVQPLGKGLQQFQTFPQLYHYTNRLTSLSRLYIEISKQNLAHVTDYKEILKKWNDTIKQLEETISKLKRNNIADPKGN